MGKPDEAKKVWDHALEISTPIQLYSRARGLQSQKRDAEAMEMFQALTKKSPQTVFGLLAQARIKSAAGDFAGAADAARQAMNVAVSDAQKTSIKTLITRLETKQDINK